MLIVYLIFIFVQDPFLGAAAIVFYPIQAWVIPKLQRRVVELQHARIANIRGLSDDIGEAVANLRDVHANAAAPWRLATLTDALHRNYVIRFDIYKRKFLIKMLNNFINQMTPFMFYSIGGYLVIVGRLDLGALVAVLAAYKDLAGPWKELLDYYQLQADMRVRYGTIVEKFGAMELEPRRRLFPEGDEAPLTGVLEFKNASAQAMGGAGALNGANVKIEPGARLSVLGSDACGRDTFLQLAAGLVDPDSGSVSMGGRDLSTVSESTVSNALAFIDGAPAVFSGSLRDNMRYGLLRPPEMDEEGADADQRERLDEARRTDNLALGSDLDWTGYRLSGVDGPDAFDARLLELCDAFGLQSELRGSGLNAQIDPDERPQLAEAITQARRRLVEREGALEEISDVVEFWDRRRFNENATIAENVLFGMPRDRSVALINIPKLPEVEKVLAGTEAALALSNIGLAVVNAMIELLRSVSADSRLMKDMNLIKLEDLPVYERIAKRASERGLSGLRASERARLAGVAFGLNPARHRLGVMKEEWREAVLTAREMMEPVRAAGDVLVAFDSDKFIPGLSLRDNLLVGKPRLNRRERWEHRVGRVRPGTASIRGRGG